MFAAQARKDPVEFSDLTFAAKISEGEFGPVYRGKWKDCEVVIKCVRNNRGVGVEREVRVI